MKSYLTLRAAVLALGASLATGGAGADIRHIEADPQTRVRPAAQIAPAHQQTVDLVLALDVSGSMSGLIDSARQRLWDIVNVMGEAEPRPALRVAVLSYGNPAYGSDTGYVRIDQPFTTDLDSVSEVLFSFGTSGGTEYVARAIDTAVRQLDWSAGSDNLRVLFVAGNESATQDPVITLDAASGFASQHNIVVNTLFCGDLQQGRAIGWDRAAILTDGLYASINQNAAAVAQIETPMDVEIAKLNQSLNETYVGFGEAGKEAQVKRQDQDANAAAMSLSSVVSRTVTKAGELYRSAWDLVDAFEDGVSIHSVDEADLPEVMQAMSPADRESYVFEQAEARSAIRDEISQLAGERQRFIAAKKAEQEVSEPGLDTAITEALSRSAAEKGIQISAP